MLEIARLTSGVHSVRNNNTRSNIIIGGGPVGSSLAFRMAKHRQPVTLIHRSDWRGSHNDKSRLARLALDGSHAEYITSQTAIRHLEELNDHAGGKVLTSQPGILFIATENTDLAKRMKHGEMLDKSLKSMTQHEVNARFSGYGFNFPKGTLFWYHAIGYVVNPVELTNINRSLAKRYGCEIVDDDAHIVSYHNGFTVGTSQGQQFSTDNLFLLAGAKNKEIAKAAQLPIDELKNTYLTAISTIRYKNNATQRGLMPIIVGSLKHKDFDHLLDFSTMPESSAIVKTRLSGPTGTELINEVVQANSLPADPIKQMSLKLFGEYFSGLGQPIDFNRGITYRNTSPHVNGLSFLNAQFTKNGTVEHLPSFANLTTTLGCYGVHVKYGALLADAITTYRLNKFSYNGFSIDRTRICNYDYITEYLPKFSEFLNVSGLAKTIGRTPLKQISDNLYFKLEGNNFSGSIKDRVALYVLLKKIERGEIKDGNVLVVATSGSYGVSILSIKRLIQKHLNINLNVIIITPKAYREKAGISVLREMGLPEKHESEFNVDTDLQDTLLTVDGAFDNAIKAGKHLGTYKNCLYIDQHFDSVHVEAHKSTAKELFHQLPEVTDVVSTTGTGATATGLCLFLPPHIKVHSRPAVSGKISGLTDARKYGNFFDAKRLVGYDKAFLDPTNALKFKEQMRARYNLPVSDSTGAAMSIAEEVLQQDPKAVIAVISPSNSY